MIHGIVGWSLQFRLLLLVLVVGMVAFGVGQIRNMAVDTYPEFQPVRVEVRAEALGLSADEVAELVTVPLEADLLNTVPWIDVIRSQSVPGMSSIEMIFQEGTDLLEARQVVQERLSEALAALPNVSTPPQMLQPTSSTNRVMMVALSSQELSLIDLSVLARWNIRPRLLGVPGVANVAIWGQREQQLQVQVDPVRLQAEDVPLIDVIETTANALWASNLSFVEASYPGTGGFIDTPNQRLGVQHISPISTPEELALVPLENRPDLTLAGIGTVVTDHQPLIGDAILNSGAGLLLVVEKFPGSNTLKVTRDIESAIEDLRPGLTGVEIDSDVYRPAAYIDQSIDNLTIGALVAAVLVALVVAAFLFDWRALVVAAISLPVSLFASVLVLNYLGEGLNSIVLAGLVVGLVVIIDDVVSTVEGLNRRLGQASADAPDPSSLVLAAVAESRSTMLFVALIALLVVSPLLFLEGVSGAFFPPFAVAYAVAIVVSLVVALTLAPALAALLLPHLPESRRESPVASAFADAYDGALSQVTRMPVAVVAAAGVVVVIGLALLTQVGQPSFLPTLKERDLLVRMEASPGTSHPEISRVTALVVKELLATPGVEDVGAHVGRAISGDQVVNINSGEIWVHLQEDVDVDQSIAAIQAIADGYAGIDARVGNLPEQRVEEFLSGPDKDITVRIYGEVETVLEAQAASVLGILSIVDGIVDAEIEYPEVQPTVLVRVDLEAAAAVGLKPGDVRRTAATMLSGVQVGSLFEDQKVFEVVVWSTPDTRSSLTSVEDLLIRSPVLRAIDIPDCNIFASQPARDFCNQPVTGDVVDCTDFGSSREARLFVLALDPTDENNLEVPDNSGNYCLTGLGSFDTTSADTFTFPVTGQYVRLGDVAQVTVQPQPTVVKREAVSRYIDVTANADGRGIGAIESDIEDAIPTISFPLEYHAEVIGEKTAEGRIRSAEIVPVVLAAAIAVYLLLQAMLGSWRLSAIAFVVLPAGLIGGVFAIVLVEGGDMNVGTYAGFFALLALSVRFGTGLFAAYLAAQRGGAELGVGLVTQAARLRAMPVLLTSVAVLAAMLPLAVAGGSAGFEVVGPLAVVVIGGLVSVVLLSLFVLPAIYLLAGPKSVAPASDADAAV